MVFLIIFGAIIIVLLLRGVFLEKKRRLELYDSLVSGFGKNTAKNYRYGVSGRKGILKRFPAKKIIDDITWEDLDMERVYERLDKCRSEVGEEYLYYLLHLENEGNDRLAFDRIVSSLYEEKEKRTELMMSLSRLGYVKGLSPFDYLDHLTAQKTSFPVRHIVFDILYIPAIVLIFFFPVPGAIFLFVLIALNILLYFRDKNKLDGLVESLGFLIRLSREGLKLLEHDYEPIGEEIAELRGSEGFLKYIRNRGMYLSVSGQGNSGSGSIAEIFLTYVNMIFHFDLIEYDLLLGRLSGKKETIVKLLFLFGKIDAAISVADFRAFLGDKWCRPEFTSYDPEDRSSVTIRMEDGYHPLVENCVTNSVCTEKGMLLTGSNASGKSTFLRMTAINCILAQTIYTVCCKRYSAPVFSIYSSIALKDNLAGKESYFIVEIKSVKRIIEDDLKSCPVICFIDEVLSGTNTVERISASGTILRYLSSRNILCFAATHDGELADMLSDCLDNHHFGENAEGTDVSFDYRVLEGKASSRNAIRLLAAYGYPAEIVGESEKMALKLDAKI